MNTGGLKTTMWYKCLVCYTCFQLPKALIVHRMKSKCRFQYKEIHKQRSKWSFETPLLENLEQEPSRLKDLQQLIKSPKPIDKAQESIVEPTGQSEWPFETPLLDNLNQEASPLKDSQLLIKSTKTIEKAKEPTEQCSNEVNSIKENIDKAQESVLELTEQCSNEVKASVPDLAEKLINLDLNQVTSCNVEPLNPLPKNQITNLDDLKNQTIEESDEHKSESLTFDIDGMRSDKVKLPTSGFICNLCQKSYCTKQSLNLHISSVHEKLKPYSCKECSKSFSTKLYLKLHFSAVHLRLKPYSCKQCPKSFGQPKTLRVHISMIHERLRLNYCKQCPKTFSSKQYLNLHISAVHQDLRQYYCKECSKNFSTNQHFKLHVSRFHKIVKKA